MKVSTQWLKLDSNSTDHSVLEPVAACLRGGGLVVIPTETVYGLAAHALDPQAVQRIFEAKGRPASNPVIVHVASVAEARALSSSWPAQADALAKAFWPGPLTLVVPRGPSIPDIVTAGGDTVALRVPSHPIMRALLAASGLPLAAPSANRSEGLSPTSAEHVRRDLDGRVDFVLDAGPSTGGIESTVVDVTGVPKILRPGLITRSAIESILGPMASGEPTHSVADQTPKRSPGQMARHYAPRATVYREHDPMPRIDLLLGSGTRIGWLAIGPCESPPGVVRIAMPGNATDYSRQLYAALHELDRESVEAIVVTLPPEGDAWAAVHDRLRRAAVR